MRTAFRSFHREIRYRADWSPPTLITTGAVTEADSLSIVGKSVCQKITTFAEAGIVPRTNSKLTIR
jgi:hypothetical protein